MLRNHVLPQEKQHLSERNTNLTIQQIISDMNPEECIHCGTVIKSKSHMKNHLKRVHKQVRGGDVCRGCSTILNNFNYLSLSLLSNLILNQKWLAYYGCSLIGPCALMNYIPYPIPWMMKNF